MIARTLKLKEHPLPTLPYPVVLSEWDTVKEALRGRSISRIGDGELRLCIGGKHIAQDYEKALGQELRDIIRDGKSLCCIPNVEAETRKPEFWAKHSIDEFRALYDQTRTYGSSLICRPDSAPWIDQPDYWLMVRRLWKDQDVALVLGERGGSLTHLVHARRVVLVYGPERDAYRDIDRIERDVLRTGIHRVLICLGPAATCLAERLCRQGLHACDLGHMGRFMPQRYLQK